MPAPSRGTGTAVWEGFHFNMMKMSANNQKRGHWPRGKRRAAQALPAGLRRKIERALERGETSLRGIARALGVSDRTIRRWMSGEDWPLAEHVEALRRHV